MDSQINSKLINAIKMTWPLVKGPLASIGISFVIATAACHLIPDQAVMSKEEIENKQKLEPRELLIRKAAIPAIIYAGCKLPGNIMKAFQMSRNPGILPKLLALAKTLSLTPSFMMAYGIIKHKIEMQEPTLNVREILKEAPITPKTMATMGTLGTISQYGIAGSMDAAAEEAMRNAATAKVI